MSKKKTDDEVIYKLTEKGIVEVLFTGYGIKADFSPTVAEHFVEDFLELLCKQGIVGRAEDYEPKK